MSDTLETEATEAYVSFCVETDIPTAARDKAIFLIAYGAGKCAGFREGRLAYKPLLDSIIKTKQL